MTSSRELVAGTALEASTSNEPMTLAVHVQTKTGTFSFPCRDDQSILNAGLSAGHDLPYECSTGTCGSCHARVASGQVDAGWRDAPGYAKLDLAKGDVLMCQAQPGTDCAIRVRISLDQPATPGPRLLRRTGRVVALNRLTKDVIHFVVDLSDPMDFEAGQFVGLRHAGVVGVRAYSMINDDPAACRLGFAVKRKPGGRLSDEMFDGVFLGRDLEILGPYGRATFRPNDRRDFICIAGGSGIAGMMAILARARSSGHFRDRSGSVFFGVRTRADAFFVAEFAEAVNDADGRLNVVIAISDEADVPGVHPGLPERRHGQGVRARGRGRRHGRPMVGRGRLRRWAAAHGGCRHTHADHARGRQTRGHKVRQILLSLATRLARVGWS